MQRDDQSEPTLDDIFAAENQDAINQKFYENPAAVLKGVASAALREGQRQTQAQREHEAVAASREAHWDKFWRTTDISRADRAEVRRHLTEAFSGADKELTEYAGDPEGAFDLMASKAEQHLAELAKQRAEDAELSVFAGGPGSEHEADPEDLRPDPSYSLSNIIKTRQSKLNRRR